MLLNLVQISKALTLFLKKKFISLKKSEKLQSIYKRSLNCLNVKYILIVEI